MNVVKIILSPLASLKLTVVLLGLSTFLVFVGTLAQIDKGIWTVVNEYFRCFLTWVDLAVFCPRTWDVPGWLTFPFPGGRLIGLGLLINILAAHGVRFKIGASGSRLAGGLGVLAVGGALTWLVIIGVFDKDIAHTEGDAFWRVLFRLGKGGGAAIVLMIGCMMVFKKRAGIVLLHGGIILLLVHEMFTGYAAVEGRMRIEQGEAKNYVEHTHNIELVFVDRSNPEFDWVSVLPSKILRRGGVISYEQLPFDVEVVKYMKNSRLVDAARAGSNFENLATVGAGLIAAALEQPEISGTDASQRIDVPAAYVTLKQKNTGDALGTYMVTLGLDQVDLPQQTATAADGRKYDIDMRFGRSYKPYSIQLLEFRHDKYVGTETPKNFSSRVRVLEPAKGVEREVTIWMNNPLRYAGETFYQSSFEPGKAVTILQVVRNDGWMLPYLSCMIVGVGLSVQFGSHLLGFLRRRQRSVI